MNNHQHINNNNRHQKDVSSNEGIAAIDDEDYECGKGQDGADEAEDENGVDCYGAGAMEVNGVDGGGRGGEKRGARGVFMVGEVGVVGEFGGGTGEEVVAGVAFCHFESKIFLVRNERPCVIIRDFCEGAKYEM